MAGAGSMSARKPWVSLATLTALAVATCPVAVSAQTPLGPDESFGKFAVHLEVVPQSPLRLQQADTGEPQPTDDEKEAEETQENGENEESGEAEEDNPEPAEEAEEDEAPEEQPAPESEQEAEDEASEDAQEDESSKEEEESEEEATEEEESEEEEDSAEQPEPELLVPEENVVRPTPPLPRPEYQPPRPTAGRTPFGQQPRAATDTTRLGDDSSEAETEAQLQPENAADPANGDVADEADEGETAALTLVSGGGGSFTTRGGKRSRKSDAGGLGWLWFPVGAAALLLVPIGMLLNRGARRSSIPPSRDR